jgi:hypothetical protein
MFCVEWEGWSKPQVYPDWIVMRLIISVALYLLALTLILLGIAERTVWAPKDSKDISVTIVDPKPLLVVPNDILKLNPGQPVVTVNGPGRVYVATGRESDITAWVGGSAKSLVTYTKQSKKLGSTDIMGLFPSANPNGSDLWRTERAANLEVSVKVETVNENALIIASDGLAAAPDKVTIKWHQDYDLTPSYILINTGFGLLLITLIYNFLVFRNIRNTRRPRRKLPRAPQGPRSRPKRRESSLPPKGRRSARRTFAVIPVTLMSLSLLTGCSPASQSLTPTAKDNANNISEQPAALQIGQIRRIVAAVATIAKGADQANSSTQLLPRFAGPALEMRDAAYGLLKKTKKAPALEPIYASPLTLSLPAATSDWPRTLMVATGNKKGTAPQMLVLRQDAPRKQYQVIYLATLASGVKLPQVPAVTQGSVPVSPDSAYLELSPNELPTAYGSLIDSGSSSEFFGKFELSGDKFYQTLSVEQKKQIETLTKAKLTYQHVIGDAAPIGLATADGGALVAVYMKDITKIKPTRSNSGITVNALQQVALGAKGSLKGVVTTYGDMLLFYVPSVGQEAKVRLLGWQTGLLKVKSL